MTAETLYIRELDARLCDGIQVRLFWNQGDGSLSVAVTDTKTADAFVIEVRPGEKPLDVFRHPYAYAAVRGIPTGRPDWLPSCRDALPVDQ